MNKLIDVRAAGGQAAGRDITNYYSQHPCAGIDSCPYRSPVGVLDAKEENEFHRDTGIRAGPIARRLLTELQARHGVPWRGSGSLSRMWHQHTIEYLDGHSSLRIAPSRLWLGHGWVVFWLGVTLILLGMAAFASPASGGSIERFVPPVAYLCMGTGISWYAVEMLIAPNTAAAKLLKKELQQHGSPQ